METAHKRKTIQELFPFFSPKIVAYFEREQKAWELLNGELDDKVKFTSEAPRDVQNWLLKNQPQSYYDGLPPFVKRCLERRVHLAILQKRHDDLPDLIIELLSRNKGRLERQR